MCSVSIVSLLLSLSSLSSSVSLTPATSSLLSIQFQRSVSVVPRFRRSTSALFQFTGFLFIALASIVLRFRFQYPIVFVSSPSSTRFSTSSRSRHLYNMSPIMTFLVSGLLPFVLASLRRLFILGFLAMSPVPFMASCFSLGVQVGCCHAVGSKIPAKLPFLPGVQVGCCLPLGLKIPAKLHFLVLCFVSASHFVSVLLSFIDPSSSLFLASSPSTEYLTSRFYVSLILDIRSSSYPFVYCLSVSPLSVVFSSSFSSSFSSQHTQLPSVCFSAIFDIPCLPSVSSFVFGCPSSSIPLILLGCSRYRPSSPVSSPCRYRSCSPSFPPSSHPAFRLLFLRPSVYLFHFPLPAFHLSPVIILRLPSLSSFVFYFAFLISSFVFLSSSVHLVCTFLFSGSTRLSYHYPHRSRLSFLFSPIDHLRLNPSSYPSSFLRIMRPLRPTIPPSTSFVASTSFLDCSGFSPPFRLGFLAASPIAGSIRGV